MFNLEPARRDDFSRFDPAYVSSLTDQAQAVALLLEQFAEQDGIAEPLADDVLGCDAGLLEGLGELVIAGLVGFVNDAGGMRLTWSAEAPAHA